jgi:hypothetical protein
MLLSSFRRSFEISSFHSPSSVDHIFGHFLCETLLADLTMATITVLLLVPAADETPYTETLCETLYEKFGITQVIVRSATAPADRLLTAVGAGPVLYVVLGTPTPSTAILEAESSAPVLKFEGASDPVSTALAIAKFCSLASAEVRAVVQTTVFCSRQARLVEDAQWRTRSAPYAAAITTCFDQNLQITGDNVQVEGCLRGKVRDRYPGPKHLALVTTDRQSGFDRQLAQVPFKGAVLNLTSAFWFETTAHIIPNHLISVPHPYVSIVKKCTPFPIEFVVR